MRSPLQMAKAKYMEHCLPAEADSVQVIETSRAWMAGAAAMYDMLTRELSQLPEDIACKCLEKLGEEFYAFAEKVKSGKA